MPKQASLPPLWICPRCGHALAGRNMSHSCGNYDLAHHFAKRPAAVRQVFDQLRALIEDLGPVTVEPQKTRIVFLVRVRFAGVIVQSSGLNTHFWLTRPVQDPRFKIEEYGPTTFVHRFKLSQPTQLDAQLKSLLQEAYAVGCQEHLL
jgi:ribosomal protein L32